MTKDKLVLKKETPNKSGWKPIIIAADLYDAVRALSEESGLPLSKVARSILEFVIERVEIEKE